MGLKQFLPFTTIWYRNRLEHPKWGVRKNAVQALITKGRAYAIDLFDDNNTSVRECAVEILGKLAEPECVEFLATKGLSDKSHWVRQAVVRTLGQIGGYEALEALASRGLADQVDQVRKAAAYALAASGDHRAINVLMRTLTYSDSQSDRDYAKASLDRLDVSKQMLVDGYIEVLCDDEYYNWLMTQKWSNPSPIGRTRPVDPLDSEKLNKAQCNRIRLRALTALREFDDAGAIPAVKRILSNPEIDEKVLAAARKTLEVLKKGGNKTGGLAECGKR